MNYTNVIRRKLINLSGYIQELEPFLKYTYEDYTGNYFVKRTGERLIQLIVENMVDINSIIIAERSLDPPKDYYTSFEILGESALLPDTFTRELAPCTGLRNRLVHEYDKIQDAIVFNSISRLIDMSLEYMGYINNILRKEE